MMEPFGATGEGVRPPTTPVLGREPKAGIYQRRRQSVSVRRADRWEWAAYHEVGGLETRAFPRCEALRARLGELVDIVAEDELDAARADFALDVVAELVGVDRCEQLRAAVHDRDLLVRVHLLDLPGELCVAGRRQKASSRVSEAPGGRDIADTHRCRPRLLRR